MTAHGSQAGRDWSALRIMQDRLWDRLLERVNARLAGATDADTSTGGGVGTPLALPPDAGVPNQQSGQPNAAGDQARAPPADPEHDQAPGG